MTDGAVNKPDEVSRTVASGRKRKEKKVKRQRKEKRGRMSLKEKLAEAVVSEVADKAISELCVSKVIDSLVKIGKIELHQLGRFNIPALLSMTVHPSSVNSNSKIEHFCFHLPITDRPYLSRWRASEHI